MLQECKIAGQFLSLNRDLNNVLANTNPALHMKNNSGLFQKLVLDLKTKWMYSNNRIKITWLSQ